MKSPISRPLSLSSVGFSTMDPAAVRPTLPSRSPSDQSVLEEDHPPTPPTPDLNREVAALSNKLISAINHQTKLDDSLAATKHELDLSKARIRHLESLTKEHADMMAKGLLVEKKAVESETQLLLSRLKEEVAQRIQAEREKRAIEQELENLTTALFDEANKVRALILLDVPSSIDQV